jgi:hypothetical protein
MERRFGMTITRQSFAEKVAFVTGAGSGIGRATFVIDGGQTA